MGVWSIRWKRHCQEYHHSYAGQRIDSARRSGEADDWFEILNVGREDIDLRLGIHRDSWYVEALSIVKRCHPRIGAVSFFADKDEAQGPLHTALKLSKGDGEILTV